MFMIICWMVHPQQGCRWHQAEWCGQHSWGMGCHPEGPRQAWEVGLCEPLEVQQGQVEGPAHGSGQTPVSVQAGGWRDWEQPFWEGLGGTGGWEAQHDLAMCAGSPEGQPWLHPQQCGHWAREGILPLCPALLRPPRESCVQLWSPQHRTELELWERGRRRSQQWSEGWSPSAGRRGWESWGRAAWGREGSGETWLWPFGS